MRDRKHRSRALTTLLAGTAFLACGDPAPSDHGGSAGRAAAGASGAASGASGAGGTVALLDPGRKDMHRLSTVEYNATVGDVLDTKLQPADGNWRGGELAGFDNIASVLGVDEAQYDRYFTAAKTLASEVLATDAQRSRFFSCDPSNAACARSAIDKAGFRLFRRPLRAEELDTYARVYEKALALGDEPLAALELAFQALLASAEFIYRIELDPEPESTVPHPLGAFELASRLSYFLWSSAPDEELLARAADDSLRQPEVLSAAVDRMLLDARSERFIAEFGGQWLGTRKVLTHPVAPSYYSWTPDVARAAGDEMLFYFSEFVRGERSWFEFPVADFNYVNDWLALFYGMPSVQVGTRVEITDDQRRGFFGLAGFLALTSYDRRTSPSLRGRWIASNLLCNTPPDPPPDVPKLEADSVDPTTTDVRRMLEAHRQNPACIGCHELFDAYGFALEAFDGVGQYRTAYPDGSPVNVSATLPPTDAYPDGQPIVGLDDLANAVAADPQLGKCLAEKLLTYGLGRVLESSDEPHLEQALADWLAPGSTPNVRRLIHALVLTEAFRFRRGESAPEAQP